MSRSSSAELEAFRGRVNGSTSASAVDWAVIAEGIPEPVAELARDPDGADAFALDERMRTVLRSTARVDWRRWTLVTPAAPSAPRR